MVDEAIHGDLIEIALSKGNGTDFERFTNFFYPALAGVEFIPLGGNKDGGADAFQDVWADREIGIFYQASIQENYQDKIVKTVERLKDFGRNPNSLYYITSRKIPKIDVEERRLSTLTGINLRIRDGAYIASHVNDNAQTRGAFRDHLGHTLEFLKHIGAAQTIQPSNHVKSPAVFVFLQQEIERRTGQSGLSEAVVDSLVLWALEGTDPDKGIFRTRKEIHESIINTLPFAKSLIENHLSSRLKHLASKQNATGREIKHHQKEDLFCLPYETRIMVQEENASNEALRIRVLDEFEERVGKLQYAKEYSSNFKEICNLALLAVQKTFEMEGLEFAAFLENKTDSGDYVNLGSCIDSVVIEAGIKPVKKAILYIQVISEILRNSFYDSSPNERLLYGKYGRTYSLFFSLKAEPRVITFFQDMTTDFYLYVGSDIIVRALSERYVHPEDQRVRNLLKILASAGATLVLAEPVLQEVQHNLHTSNLEFDNNFAGIESKVTEDIVRNCPKILIRSFFYARMSSRKDIEAPSTWLDYLRQFCNPDRLNSEAGKEELKRYLMANFSLQYESFDEMEKIINFEKNRREFDSLESALLECKANRHLAKNDAMMAFTVYGRRDARGEGKKANEFGHQTWWLTGETSIIKYTKALVSKHGARFMMRPEFLLNFIALVPKMADVRATYKSVFPSLLGIRLANRVKDEVFHKMMKQIKEVATLEPGRVEALIAQYSDQLKSDFQKHYDQTM